MLNLFNYVQFAYARHSSSKLASALAQSQISASHREPFLVFLRGQILKRVQDDGVWVVVGFGGLKSSGTLPFRVLSDALSLRVIFDDWVDLICALFKV